MKRLSLILLVVMVSMPSCAINQEKEIAKEGRSSVFLPKPLDDNWSKWLAGLRARAVRNYLKTVALTLSEP